MTVIPNLPRQRHLVLLLPLLLLAGCASPGPGASGPSGLPAGPTASPAPASTSAAAGTEAGAAAVPPGGSVRTTALPADAPRPATAAPPAPAGPAAPADFDQWIARLRADARAAGIDEATLHAAFDGVRHLDQVVALDRAQPEFTRPVWDYLDTAVSAQRVMRGQDKLLEVRAQADAAAQRYGVPAEIVVAIWGMESNYGSNYGDIPTIDALATLGFDGRRAAWARTQLMAALRILQNGDIPRERMIGSWAGAMGQTQFLPSNFLAYAVDADGDGRRDIWGSMADVMASTAHFLAREGWQRGQTWGLEVQLPPGFDLGRADDALRQSGAQWRAEGVRAADGGTLPDLADANLLLPAGAQGPAFLVGPNFRAILRYNNATSYALGVGLLAQRIAGGPAVQTGWPRHLQPLSRSDLQALQRALQAKGFDSGAIDGVLGPATRGAIRRWQRSAGLAADGFPTRELLEQLRQP